METVRSTTFQPEGDTRRRSKIHRRRVTFGGWLCAASLFPFIVSIGAATGWMLRYNWYYADRGAFLTGIIESGKTIPFGIRAFLLVVGGVALGAGYLYGQK